MLGLGLGLPFARKVLSMLDMVASLGGALFEPSISNCWQDFANTAGAYDKKVALIESEPARPHNYIPNSTFVGGTASTAATGWVASSHNGITTTIVGMGVDADGYPRQDVRMYGTATATAYPEFIASGFVDYLLGGQYSNSVKTSIASGVTTGFDLLKFRVDYLSSSNTYATGGAVACDYKVDQPVTHTYFMASGSTLFPTAEKIKVLLAGKVLTGQTVDITIRISQPQLELSRPRAFCPTYGTAIEPQATYFAAWQGTDVSKPYLRSADYSIVPFVSGTGETWTPTYTVIDDQGGFVRSGSDAYWRNPAGTVGNYVSTPDSAASSTTGDMSQVYELTCNWRSGTTRFLAAKNGSAGARSYILNLSSANKLQLQFSVDGTNFIIKTATEAVTFANGDKVFIKFVIDVDNGASGYDVKFYSCTDYDKAAKTGTWVQIGTTVTTAGVTSIFDSTSPVMLGQLDVTNTAGWLGKIHYAAAWANTTGEGTPAWEFYPARDATFPASPWLQFDGSNDYLVTNIIPGNYSEGFICAGAVQIEAVSAVNVIFGSSVSDAVRGVQLSVGATGAVTTRRYDGTTNTSVATTDVITGYVPFVATASYSVATASAQLNSGTKETSATARDYTGTTQYALIGASNNTESGVTPANYIQGNFHALAWLPSISTEAQELAIRNYVAIKTGVTL